METISSAMKQENITIKEEYNSIQYKWPPKRQMMELIDKATKQL